MDLGAQPEVVCIFLHLGKIYENMKLFKKYGNKVKQFRKKIFQNGLEFSHY